MKAEFQSGPILSPRGPPDKLRPYLPPPTQLGNAPEDVARLRERALPRRRFRSCFRTVEALLTLATSELGPTAQETIDLATAAEDALDASQAAIDQRDIKVDATLEPARARGDRVLLERMIANLVENAVRHNNPDGWIGIRTIQQADGAVFEIANTGASMTPGSHHLTATVTFEASSDTRPRTIRATVAGCPPAPPPFTG